MPSKSPQKAAEAFPHPPPPRCPAAACGWTGVPAVLKEGINFPCSSERPGRVPRSEAGAFFKAGSSVSTPAAPSPLPPLPPLQPGVGRSRRGFSSPPQGTRLLAFVFFQAPVQTTAEDEILLLPPMISFPAVYKPRRDTFTAGSPRIASNPAGLVGAGCHRGQVPAAAGLSRAKGGAMPACGGRRIISGGSYTTDNFPA